MPCTDSRDREHPRALRLHHDAVEALCEQLISSRDVDAFEADYRLEAKAFADDIEAIDTGQVHRAQIEERLANLRARGIDPCGQRSVVGGHDWQVYYDKPGSNQTPVGVSCQICDERILLAARGLRS